ncbi:hypothetical protein [Pseudokineococcus sp. 1T1Z-3]|uniref:hypothetical protein n=1 Tax=Pseudokineococcus sp. 1T1Z-3 TaxID=3132745 RepID=UPI0030987BE6
MSTSDRRRSSPDAAMQVVVHEDRPAQLVGARLAVASLLRQVPTADVLLWSPGAGADLAAWCAARPRVRLDASSLPARGWDVKPAVLLALLEQHEQALWVDSDVLVWGDLAARLAQVPPSALVVAGETPLGQALGGSHRTRAWGLEVGRPLPTTANTGVVRVHRGHRPLLEAWRDLLADERYRGAQSSPWQERPLHLLGDQEVLTALLGSAEFASLEVEVLRQGRDVAQCFGPAGWLPADRLACVRRGAPPVLVHAMGHRKPYAPGRPATSRSGRLRARYEGLHHRLGPYGALAAALAPAALAPVDDRLPWARGTRGWRAACLRELPLAVLDLSARRLRALLGAGRLTVDGAT